MLHSLVSAQCSTGTGLITDKEGVNGIRAKKSNGEEIEIYASKVILATSGFASNEEMLKKYIPEIVDAYPLTAPGATGEGIVWGQKLGAELKNMHAYQGHAVFNLQTKGSMDLSILSRGGILVNKDGKRFTSESITYATRFATAQKILDQPDSAVFQPADLHLDGCSGIPDGRNLPVYAD